jgi:hypothetical protein
MDDTAVGIISPAATYPSVPALGFFVDGTKCDSLATNQRGGTDRVFPKRSGCARADFAAIRQAFPREKPGKGGVARTRE